MLGCGSNKTTVRPVVIGVCTPIHLAKHKRMKFGFGIVEVFINTYELVLML
jgi:hypothetical protein